MTKKKARIRLVQAKTNMNNYRNVVQSFYRERQFLDDQIARYESLFRQAAAEMENCYEVLIKKEDQIGR